MPSKGSVVVKPNADGSGLSDQNMISHLEDASTEEKESSSKEDRWRFIYAL
jgi:hypothetical protein